MTDVSAYFAQIYADSSDPWQYEKRWYEVRKRAICLSLLPYPHFAKAIELGSVADVIATTLRDGSAADVSALRARVTKLADDFPLYEGLTQ